MIRSALLQVDQRPGLGDVGHQVAVGEHDALGQPGGAAGVGQRDQVVGRVELDLRRRAPGCRAGRAGAACPSDAVQDDDLVDRRLLDGGRGAVQEQRDGDQHLRAGVAQLEGDLLGRVERVDRAHHAAGGGDAVEDDRVPEGVRAEDGDDVALAQAPLVQRGGHPVDVAGQLAVGDRVALEAVDQRRGVRPLPAGGQHELGHRQVRDLDVGVRAGQDHGALLLGCWCGASLTPGATRRQGYPPVSPREICTLVRFSRRKRAVCSLAGLSAARAPTGCTGTARSSGRCRRRSRRRPTPASSARRARWWPPPRSAPPAPCRGSWSSARSW